jgi:S1-C subfamily serine protease
VVVLSKIMKTIFIRVLGLLITISAMMGLAITSFAQTVAPEASTVVQSPAALQVPATVQPQVQPPAEKTPPRRQPRRASTPPATVTVVADQTKVAPQVVTIVHRLTGVKMLRFLLRQGGDESGTLYTIDPEAISSDAHASIIAGWVLGDGKTIAARLPQAGAEMEFAESPFVSAELMSQLSRSTTPRPLVRPSAEPDVTVITRDGRKLRARYIGLDGETGLSVLQLGGPVMSLPAEEPAKALIEGQGIQIFAPERATPEGETSSRIIYVKVGEVDASIADLTKASAGKRPGLTARGAKLSPLVIGGIVCDTAGNTLGIVDAIEGTEARIVSADNVRAATKRVLERQASVPRPLLGVRGEPVEFATRAAFMANGWNDHDLTDLIRQQVGILLTSVMPGTPAALAKLYPGDVIVRVNQEEVKSAEEFSQLLGEAGSGKEVKFSVRRPTSPTPLLVDVKLGGSFDPLFKWRFEMPMAAARGNGLERFGAETMALSTGGLLVVAVQPESVAARGGILEGDVIESIDGRLLGRGAWASRLEFGGEKKHVLSLVRKREKKQIVLNPVD